MKHLLSGQADEIIRLAKDIAREYGQGYVGTEHLLLAIVRHGDNIGAEILHEHRTTELDVQEKVHALIKARMQDTWVIGRLPGTPHFRDVVARAVEAARGQGNGQICPEHLLLALLAEKGSVGYSALTELGLNYEMVRKAVTHRVTAT